MQLDKRILLQFKDQSLTSHILPTSFPWIRPFDISLDVASFPSLICQLNRRLQRAFGSMSRTWICFDWIFLMHVFMLSYQNMTSRRRLSSTHTVKNFCLWCTSIKIRHGCWQLSKLQSYFRFNLNIGLPIYCFIVALLFVIFINLHRTPKLSFYRCVTLF